MDDVKTILAGMPPGADLFDYLSTIIDENVSASTEKTYTPTVLILSGRSIPT
jgi:hypothetical protein